METVHRGRKRGPVRTTARAPKRVKPMTEKEREEEKEAIPEPEKFKKVPEYKLDVQPEETEPIQEPEKFEKVPDYELDVQPEPTGEPTTEQEEPSQSALERFRRHAGYSEEGEEPDTFTGAKRVERAQRSADVVASARAEAEEHPAQTGPRAPPPPPPLPEAEPEEFEEPEEFKGAKAVPPTQEQMGEDARVQQLGAEEQEKEAVMREPPQVISEKDMPETFAEEKYEPPETPKPPQIQPVVVPGEQEKFAAASAQFAASMEKKQQVARKRERGDESGRAPKRARSTPEEMETVEPITAVAPPPPPQPPRKPPPSQPDLPQLSKPAKARVKKLFGQQAPHEEKYQDIPDPPRAPMDILREHARRVGKDMPTRPVVKPSTGPILKLSQADKAQYRGLLAGLKQRQATEEYQEGGERSRGRKIAREERGRRTVQEFEKQERERQQREQEEEAERELYAPDPAKPTKPKPTKPKPTKPKAKPKKPYTGPILKLSDKERAAYKRLTQGIKERQALEEYQDAGERSRERKLAREERSRRTVQEFEQRDRERRLREQEEEAEREMYKKRKPAKKAKAGKKPKAVGMAVDSPPRRRKRRRVAAPSGEPPKGPPVPTTIEGVPAPRKLTETRRAVSFAVTKKKSPKKTAPQTRAPSRTTVTPTQQVTVPVTGGGGASAGIGALASKIDALLRDRTKQKTKRKKKFAFHRSEEAIQVSKNETYKPSQDGEQRNSKTRSSQN